MSPRLARFAPVLVFLLGLFTGVAVTVLWAGHRLRNFAENGPAKITRIGIAAVSRRLDLDAAQRAKFAPLFGRVEAGFGTVHREGLVQVRTLMETAAAEMRPQLRPDQQAKLDELMAAPRRRWEKFLGPVPEETRAGEKAAGSK